MPDDRFAAPGCVAVGGVDEFAADAGEPVEHLGGLIGAERPSEGAAAEDERVRLDAAAGERDAPRNGDGPRERVRGDLFDTFARVAALGRRGERACRPPSTSKCSAAVAPDGAAAMRARSTCRRATRSSSPGLLRHYVQSPCPPDRFDEALPNRWWIPDCERCRIHRGSTCLRPDPRGSGPSDCGHRDSTPADSGPSPLAPRIRDRPACGGCTPPTTPTRTRHPGVTDGGRRP